MSQAQSAMGASNYEKLRSYIREKESGNRYSGGKVDDNGFGYSGAYQFGAQALQSQGLIKQGIVTDYGSLGRTQAERAAAHSALMNDPNNWTIKGGKQTFLQSREIQDRAFDRLADQNYRTLKNAGIIKDGDPPDKVAGYLSAAHLKGAGSIIKNGVTGVDGLGTSAESRYLGAAKAVSGTTAALPPNAGKGTKTQAASKEPEKRQLYNSAEIKLGNSKIAKRVSIGASSISEEAIPLPQVNPLSNFSSFNCVFTLSNITVDAHREPNTSYKAGNLGEIILRSAGAGTRAQSTAMVTESNPSGQYDFFIDNIDINSIITFNPKTKGSNATDISFDVIEPYSMGLFMQACEVAAIKNGWPNGYLNSVFLLTIEFVGYDSEGRPITIPNTTRNIPLTIKDMSMTAKASGAVYKVKGHPSNEIPLDNNYRLFDVDISVSGKTVQEILQTGEFSLQTVVNKRLQEFAEKEKVETAFDEIVIVFPKVNEPGSQAFKDRNATTRTTSAITVSRKTSASNLIQDTDTLNNIGLSAMDFDMTTSGEAIVNKHNQVQEDPTKPAVRSKVIFDSKTRQFIYSQGTSIINAITSILLNSKYCKTALEERKVNPDGFIDWFRIETAIDYHPPKAGNYGNNTQPKLLIFKVVPYKAHSAKSTAPSAPVKGYDKLMTEVAKVYDYIYTGRNTEVINFELEFKQAFFNTIARDQSKQHRELFLSGQRSASTTGSTAPVTPNNSPGVVESLPGRETQGRSLENRGEGGTTAEDYKTSIAKTFQAALNDSATDLVLANITVMGDPYFLADSGMGNFSNTGSGRFNITDTFSMDYQNGEVDIIINFRTPLDYNNNTGIMDFGSTQVVEEFSGLYKVNFVNHKFQKGKFTQELQLQRRPKQSAKPLTQTESLEIQKRNIIGQSVLSEDGTVAQGVKINPETGETYYTDIPKTATADPKSSRARSRSTTVVAANSATPALEDATEKSTFNGAP